MRRPMLVPVALLAGLILTAVPATASADDLSLTVGSTARLVAGVEVDVPMTVSCDLPPPLPGTGVVAMTNVQLEEAVGKSIARGSGFLSIPACDGSSQSLVSRVLADPSGPPFRVGTGVVTVFVSACVNTRSGYACQGGGAGPSTITIKH